MSTQKIIFKVPEFPHLSETFIVAQIVTAINLGYEVTILVRKILNTHVPSLLTEEYQLMDKVIIEDYGIPENKWSRIIGWLGIIMSNISALSSIFKYHRLQTNFSLTWLYQWHFYQRFREAKIFHVQYGTNVNPLPLLKLSGYKPALVVTFHGHDAFFPINGYIENNGYYDRLFKTASLITANTPYLAEQLINLQCPSEILCVIPVGVDNSFFHPTKIAVPFPPLRLLTVGRLDKVKGHNFCIDVVKLLVDRGTDVTLTIVGEGSQRKFLEQQISKYGLENTVFLPGMKSPEEVRQYYWNHHIYLLLAVPLADGRRETQGLATLEAQACGLGAIVFDSGGVKSTVVDNLTGFVCEEYNIKQVASKIESLYQTPQQISELGKAAIQFVDQNYSQKLLDNRWNEIYRAFSSEDVKKK